MFEPPNALAAQRSRIVWRVVLRAIQFPAMQRAVPCTRTRSANIAWDAFPANEHVLFRYFVAVVLVDVEVGPGAVLLDAGGW